MENITVDAVVARVTTRLGGSQTDVELVKDDILEGIVSAVEVYNQYRPREMRTTLPNASGNGVYYINRTGLIGVKGVDTASRLPASTDYMFDPFLNYVSRPDYAPSLAMLQMQYAKSLQKIAGTDLAWYGQWEQDRNNGQNKVFALYIRMPPGNDIACGFTYTFAVTADDHPQTGLSWIKKTDHDWFINFVEAKAKQILGPIRDKFSGIPDVNGGQSPNNGATITEQGRQDEERLTAVIKGRRKPLPPKVF